MDGNDLPEQAFPSHNEAGAVDDLNAAGDHPIRPNVQAGFNAADAAALIANMAPQGNRSTVPQAHPFWPSMMAWMHDDPNKLVSPMQMDATDNRIYFRRGAKRNTVELLD